VCVNGIHPFSPLNSQPPIEVNESPAIHSHFVYISEGLLFVGDSGGRGEGMLIFEKS
jgi:hypothetical protein